MLRPTRSTHYEFDILHGTFIEVEDSPTPIPDANDINPTFLVPRNLDNPNEPQTLHWSQILKGAGMVRKFVYDNTELYKKLKNAKINLGYVEETDKGLHEMETVSMSELSNHEYIISEAGLLKDGLKNIKVTILEYANAFSSVPDVGLKGPAYFNPMTGATWDTYHKYMTGGMAGEYGATLFENVGFKDAVQKGYQDLVNFIYKTKNSGKFVFAYTTGNILGKEEVTDQFGISRISGGLTTFVPLSPTQLKLAEIKNNLKIKYVYWGVLSGDVMLIFGKIPLE